MVYISMFISGQGCFKSWITVIKMTFLCITLFNAKIEWGENTDKKKLYKWCKKVKYPNLTLVLGCNMTNLENDFDDDHFKTLQLLIFLIIYCKKKQEQKAHINTLPKILNLKPRQPLGTPYIVVVSFVKLSCEIKSKEDLTLICT